MSVYINFEPDNLNGWVAEGTYLLDAARRLGVRFGEDDDGEKHLYVVKIKEGATLLSPVVTIEREKLGEERIASGERLADQAKVLRAGEVKLEFVPVPEMTTDAKKEEEKKELKELRAEFYKMPLEEKLRALIMFEAVTAYQTWGAVMNLPSKVFGKGFDVLADYGRKREAQEHSAEQHPSEHDAQNKTSETSSSDEVVPEGLS